MKKTIRFLKELKKNNNRDWFNAHKPRYEETQQELKDFIDAVAGGISKHDRIDLSRTKLFRIYKDVRFSTDKTPYNIHRSASFKRASEDLRGGYYLRIQPGSSCLVGGFFGPEPKDLLHIRKQIQQNPDPLRAILKKKVIRDYFGELQGDKVKSAPKGFSKDDPAIDLLRYKGFMLRHDFTDEEVCAPDFAKEVALGFKKMRPFFDYMSEILTTDLNGQSLLKF